MRNTNKASHSPACVQARAIQAILHTVVLLTLLLPVQLRSQTEPSALLDLQSTDKGFLLPRMTEAQRDEITGPATGLMIFNTTSVCLEINFGNSSAPQWQAVNCFAGTIGLLDCANAALSGTLTAGSVASGVSVSVPYTSGNGGPYGGQTVPSTGVTGLTATLAAGNFASGADSLTYTISGTPDRTGTAAFALNIGGQACSLEFTVGSGCWANVNATDKLYFQCHNLASANPSADPFTPSWEINGGYWQWGRIQMEGPGPSGPGAGEANEGAITGWNTTIAPSGSWSNGTKTATDPCPPGFRIPTQAQWAGVLANNTQSIVGSWYESATNYSSGRFFGPNLMLPAAGYRNNYDGTVFNRGYGGIFWSSTEFGSIYAWTLDFYSGNANTYGNYRTYGFSVRCAAE